MDKCNQALIMIDMQRGFINEDSPQHIKGAPATVPACAELVAGCRAQGIPVIFVVRAYRSDGSDVEHPRYWSWHKGGKPLSPGCPESIDGSLPEEFGVCDKDYIVVKPRFSAFFGTELDLILRRLGVDTVLLAGTTTPNCIRTTCFDAISLEYNTVVFSDCTSSMTEEIQRVNLKDMENAGAQIMDSRAFLRGEAEPANNTLSVRHQVLDR